MSPRDAGSLPGALAELRKMYGLTQGQLADLAGVARTAISAIERGATRPKADTLRLIAEGLAKAGAQSGRISSPDHFYIQLMDASGYSGRPQSIVQGQMVHVPVVSARMGENHYLEWMDTGHTISVSVQDEFLWRPLLATVLNVGGFEPYVMRGDMVVFEDMRSPFGQGTMSVVVDKDLGVSVRWLWPPNRDDTRQMPILRAPNEDPTWKDECSAMGAVRAIIREAYGDPEFLAMIKRDFSLHQATKIIGELPYRLAPWDEIDPLDLDENVGAGASHSYVEAYHRHWDLLERLIGDESHGRLNSTEEYSRRIREIEHAYQTLKKLAPRTRPSGPTDDAAST